MDMTIQTADAAALESWLNEELNHDTGLKYPELFDRTKKIVGFACYHDPKVIAGAISGEIYWNTLHIRLFAVKLRFRSQGIGSA